MWREAAQITGTLVPQNLELVMLTYCKTWQELAAKLEATDAQQAEAAEDRKRLEVAQITCFTTLNLLALLPTRGGCRGSQAAGGARIQFT